MEWGKQLERRSLLRAAGVMGVGAAGLALGGRDMFWPGAAEAEAEAGAGALAGDGFDAEPYVDPSLRPFLGAFPPREVGRVYTFDWVREKRGVPADPSAPLPPGPWRAVKVPVPGGREPVTIYVVNERKGRSRGGIVHMHGGGYLFGSARNSLAGLAETARALDCTLVTVEYRLAPETTYEGSREDTYAALTWLYRNAAQVGVDPARIALLGESAGGGHAALLAITARDRGEVPVAFQCLVYPMLDDRVGAVIQRPRQMGVYVWTPEENVLGWRSFLGREPGLPDQSDGVPGRVRDVAGLPPAWIGVGGVDLFLDEDVDYGQRLLDAGIGCEIVVTPGAYHAFDLIAAKSDLARQFTASKMAALARALG
ncbi:alpha/beta hydrolase [Novosphingobium sp. 1949]|uniref:Alpha/beta hydrolase n=1 Tax=Novosphingobium organovorum TaxID=2930092 RepID=A0ABT0BDD1_9SPHN|nr:alpha/beta hydrolase [Novosphingobium organovorum]MCJ2183081.1 alpha/beta hydrolase [Novosphingobium organovorum]